MKKLTLLLVLSTFTLLAKAAYPQTLPLDYSSFFAVSAMGTDPVLEKGIYLTNANPLDLIMQNQWNRSGNPSSWAGVTPVVEDNGLSFSNYIDNNKGKAIVLNPLVTAIVADPTATPPVIASTSRITTFSLTSANTVNDYTGTGAKSFYLSTLVNFSALTAEDFFISVDGTYVGNYLRGKVYVKPATDGYQFGLRYGNSTPVETTTLFPTVYQYNQTHLVVLKFTPNTTIGGSETVSLFIDPTPGSQTEPTPSITDITAAATVKYIKGISIRQRPGTAGKIAGIRFSDNWADVVKAAVPKLTAPEVQNPVDIITTGFTANWTVVPNAVGYNVNVYLGSNLVTTKYADGQATANLVVTGLPKGLIYNYKVVAKGNGTTNGDSDPSTAKEVVTATTDNVFSINTNFGDNTWGTVITGTAELPYPANGLYPSSILNGFELVNAYVRGVGSVGPNAESHTNQILLDYSTNNSMLVFPTVNSVQRIEIHAKTGSDNKGFVLKEFTGNSWTKIGDYVTMAVETIFTIPISRTIPTKFRIENSFTSGLAIFQVITLNEPSAVNAPSASNFLKLMGKTIISPEIGTMDIYNMQGIHLLHAENVIQLNTNLSNDCYLVRFINKNGQSKTQKLLMNGN